MVQNKAGAELHCQTCSEEADLYEQDSVDKQRIVQLQAYAT